MTSIIKPGSRILYMKVGTHADEPLDSIFERKRREIIDAGFSLWGYGGNTCHPLTMVQPFARSYEEKGGTIHLCMHPMNSNHLAVTTRAEEFSVDGINWQVVPDGINVTGSRYALAIRNLRIEKFRLPLAQTRVAVGISAGVAGARYISGRVDKACLEVTGEPVTDGSIEESEEIGLVAELVKPYAVFVRNKPT
jgi:hypothetical protein